jgi:hypothetical protein
VFVTPVSLGLPVARFRALADFFSILFIASTVDFRREN